MCVAPRVVVGEVLGKCGLGIEDRARDESGGCIGEREKSGEDCRLHGEMVSWTMRRYLLFRPDLEYWKATVRLDQPTI